VHAGKVKVGVTSSGNGARKAAAWVLGSTSTRVVRTKEFGWAGAGHWATRWAMRGWTGKVVGRENKDEKKEGGVGRPEKMTQHAWRERKMLSIFKTFYKL
jgi:hypothetical protein